MAPPAKAPGGLIEDPETIPSLPPLTPTQVEKSEYARVRETLYSVADKISQLLTIPGQTQQTTDALHALMTRAKNVTTTSGTASALRALTHQIATDLVPYEVFSARFPNEPA